MTKVLRTVMVVMLTAAVLAFGAGSVSAGSFDVDPMACWSNCGIGDNKTEN